MDWQIANNSPETLNIWIAGGGKVVDVVRDWDQRFELDRVQSHQLACHGLSLTCRLLATWFPGWPTIRQPESAIELETQTNLIFDPADWVLGESAIPPSWDVTSDSIAGLLGLEYARCGRSPLELVLFKSRLGTMDQLLDPHFNELLPLIEQAGIQIRIVNLAANRDEQDFEFLEITDAFRLMRQKGNGISEKAAHVDQQPRFTLP